MLTDDYTSLHSTCFWVFLPQGYCVFLVTELCEFVFLFNRARLKKECDDFKKHPEYENFIREQMDTTDAEHVSLSTHTTGQLHDEVTTLNEHSETAGESQAFHHPLTLSVVNSNPNK